jgi:hypothetical protein
MPVCGAFWQQIESGTSRAVREGSDFMMEQSEIVYVDPDSKQDYTFAIDMDEGDELDAATSWTCIPADPSILAAAPAPTVSGGRATVWIEPGAGATGTYRLVCRYVTMGGRRNDATVRIRIRDK